jgi:hypothetical protein
MLLLDSGNTCRLSYAWMSMENGRGGWIRTNAWQDQNLLPYRLATPLYLLRRVPGTLFLIVQLASNIERLLPFATSPVRAFARMRGNLSTFASSGKTQTTQIGFKTATYY